MATSPPADVEALIERIVDRNEAWLQIRASHMPKTDRRLCRRATATVVARPVPPALQSTNRFSNGSRSAPLPPYHARSVTTMRVGINRVRMCG
jgi:hypothetical protein